ncbi:hypothetical protein MKW92_049444 [Papaver armeniacum]|nr:hypothetical protein MKW92_049444 [Papaver armeniacum]
MDTDVILEQPTAVLTGIKFSLLTEEDLEKHSAVSVESVNDVTDPKMGVPNMSSECTTCGAKDIKTCEGHNGIVKLPIDLFHPFFTSEIVQILNQVCPGCKSVRTKGPSSMTETSASPYYAQQFTCKYCVKSSTDWYPKMKFKAASARDYFGKNISEIIVEVTDKIPRKYFSKGLELPMDYWDFIMKDPQQVETDYKSHRRSLTPLQVSNILKDVDPNFVKSFVPKRILLFLSAISVTPNCGRVVEMANLLTTGQSMIFDDRTKAYKRLVDFKRSANELGSRVADCLSVSKLNRGKSSNNKLDSSTNKFDFSNKKPDSSKTGHQWVKDVMLGKMTDNSFRMVIVGDPRIKLGEIGIPNDIAERLEVTECLNSWNWQKLNMCANSRLLEKGVLIVKRKGKKACVLKTDDLKIGDAVYRPLEEGDLVMINRPPSLHQHSIIALSVKILPTGSVASLNPLICDPLRGDFDGDCLQCYVPQSVDSRVELRELVTLNQQLVNGQNGQSLLSLSHDSLAAAYLLRKDDVYLNKAQIQQLEMLSLHLSPFPAIVKAPTPEVREAEACLHQRPIEQFEMLASHHFRSPAIVKAPNFQRSMWTGKQLLSMLMPQDFNFDFPVNGICVSEGEILFSSLESAWLQDTDDSIYSTLVRNYGDKTLDILFSAQEILLEWISMRGFSVSLSDIYLSSNSCSRGNMVEEVSMGGTRSYPSISNQGLFDKSYVCMENLLRDSEDTHNCETFEVDDIDNRLYDLTEINIGAYQDVFRDVQRLVYHYASKENSMLAMVRSGSKGSLLKLVHQSLCLGLQHSSSPLSFRVPSMLSCSARNHRDVDTPGSHILYAVIENSFLSGLDPLECYVHSVSNRDSSFGENAEIPGTLFRKIMFYMRDLYLAYDGTVRNAYGNQLVQFSYGVSDKVTSTEDEISCQISTGSDRRCGGEPVGSLAACSISEAAYSALDKPLSSVEDSLLLKLKKLLMSSKTKTAEVQNVTLFLSKKLKRLNYGSEYGAIAVKSHLEKVLFSEVISDTAIVFSEENCQTHLSPWICHFHISKEEMQKKGLNVASISNALEKNCCSNLSKQKFELPVMHLDSRSHCSMAGPETSCIVGSVDIEEGCSNPLAGVRDVMMPFLLGTVIKGFVEVEKVDIVWNDLPRGSRASSSGEMCLRVSMARKFKNFKFWSIIKNACLPIMDLIDWERSYPNSINDVSHAYGIEAAWAHFFRSLKSVTSDIGKSILEEHLLLIADRLSFTGEFLGLTAKGLITQTSTPSPFNQACFSRPLFNFVQAAKDEAKDDLSGTLDAVAWGKKVPIGTGGNFEIIYSQKDYQVDKLDIFNTLSTQPSYKDSRKASPKKGDKWGKYSYADGFAIPATPVKSESTPKADGSASPSENDILDMVFTLQNILYKYPVGHSLNEGEKSTMLCALSYHPRGNEKVGSGLSEIKVGYHPKYNSRCFNVVRTDGSVEDFSYRKCVFEAAKRISIDCAESIMKRFKNDNNNSYLVQEHN